jgi:hypothetical protein
MKRIPLIAVFGAVLLLTTACGPVAGPTSSPTDTSAQSDSPSPSATPTSSPPVDSTAHTAGDCTAADMTTGAIPTVYTVYTGDSTTPVTIHYTAFNRDGTVPVETLTTVGPVVNIIGYACSNPADDAVWTFTANITTEDNLGCVLDFGGLLVNNNSQGAEHSPAIPISVDCSGNPGM